MKLLRIYWLFHVLSVIFILPSVVNSDVKIADDRLDYMNPTLPGVNLNNGKLLSAILGDTFTSRYQSDQHFMDVSKVKGVSGHVNQESHGRRTDYLEITVETKNVYGEMAKVHLNYT